MNLPTKSELTAPAPAVREPVLQAIGTNLLQAETKLTAGWVHAAVGLLEQLLAERQNLYTDAAGAWPEPRNLVAIGEIVEFPDTSNQPSRSMSFYDFMPPTGTTLYMEGTTA